MKVTRINMASDLPESWNTLSESYFQTVSFLIHAENYNPCRQRYYLLEIDNQLCAGAIVYTHRQDLFTFIGIKSPVKMQVVGVPCSVSCSGMIGSAEHILILKRELYSLEKGFLLFLNLKKELINENNAHGRTLPTVVQQNDSKTYADYLSGIKHEYRRRIRKIEESAKGVTLESGSCSRFTPEMYELYCSVHKKSDAKLEKLSFDFFKHLPDRFNLHVCYLSGKIIGWNITVHESGKMFFFMGGIDYKENSKNSTYLYLLLHIVKTGILEEAKTIDFGQTAEIPKMRMGGNLLELSMEAIHSNKLFNWFLKNMQSSLSYKRTVPEVHVKTVAS